jgi:Lon protease-like protein
MTKHVLAGDQEFGVVLIDRGHEVGGGDHRCEVGTVARVVQAAELPDGRWALSTVGLRRIRVTQWLPDDPYPQAEVEAIDEPPTSAVDDAARGHMRDAFAAVLDYARRFDANIAALPAFSDDPERASYEAAAVAPIGPFDAQRVLTAQTTADRLALLTELLHERAAELRDRLALDE